MVKLINVFLIESKGIKLSRVGGLSPVKQKNNEDAPEKYGVYAFIWPYFDDFFLSSFDQEGEKPGGRLKQLDKEGTRTWNHHGRIWTRIEIQGTENRNGWYLTDADTLSNIVKKEYAKDRAEIYRMHKNDKNKKFPANIKPYGHFRFGVDKFEVFVPQPREREVK
jgi:hypothetical protein